MSRYCRPWQEEERQTLRDMWLAGADTREIARKLGRGDKSVSAMRHFLGLPRRNEPFNNDERITELFQRGESTREIARLVGRTESSVRHRLERLKLYRAKKVVVIYRKRCPHPLNEVERFGRLMRLLSWAMKKTGLPAREVISAVLRDGEGRTWWLN